MLHPFLRPQAPSALIYDLEIKRCIPGAQILIPDFIPDFCDGWTDFAGMGISCIGVYDFVTDSYRVFTTTRIKNEDGTLTDFDNFDQFAQLAASREVIIGWNTTYFDDWLLREYDIPVTTHYDLLKELRLATGQTPHFVPGVSPSGFGLDEFAQANCGVGKAAPGSLAPQLFQTGRIGELCDYCLNDVRLTKLLLEGRDALKNPLDGKIISLDAPPTFTYNFDPLIIGTTFMRTNNAPLVQLRSGAQSIFLPPQVVREIGLKVISGADAAESEAATFATLMDNTGGDREFSHSMVQQLQYRKAWGSYDFQNEYRAEAPASVEAPASDPLSDPAPASDGADLPGPVLVGAYTTPTPLKATEYLVDESDIVDGVVNEDETEPLPATESA